MGSGLISILYSSAVASLKKTVGSRNKGGPAETMARALAVKNLLQKVEDKMAKDDLKATLGDYIKLIQLSKEMEGEPKTEIKVTWIEEPEIPLIEE